MKRTLENHSDSILFAVALIGIIVIIYLFVWVVGTTITSFEKASTVNDSNVSSGGFNLDGAAKVLDARGVAK